MWSPTATVRAEHRQVAAENALRSERRSLRDHADSVVERAGQSRFSLGRPKQPEHPNAKRRHSEELHHLDVQEELLKFRI